MASVYPQGIPHQGEIAYLVGMTILTTRLSNAKLLATQIGGQSRFAERMNMSRQQASHIIGSRPHKGIGHAMARRIEKVFDVPMGWLDVTRDQPAKLSGDFVDVPLLTTATTTGEEQVNQEHQVASSVLLSKRWVKQNTQATAFEHLAVMTAMGDSMEPTFGDGAILLVDRGVSSMKIDGVYVLTKGDELFVKRVQRLLDGSLLVKSDNSSYNEISVSKKDAQSILVLGRVIVAWNAKKM